MDYSQGCREYFLNGVTDIYIYAAEKVSLPVPFSVPYIGLMENCELGEPLVSISLSNEGVIMADSITAKTTVAESGSNAIYTIEITVSISEDEEKTKRAKKTLAYNDDCYVLLYKNDGTYRFCYTLPGTFYFVYNVSNAASGESRALTVQLKSLSEFIPITLK